MKGKYKCEKCQNLIEANMYLEPIVQKCPECDSDKANFILQPLEGEANGMYMEYFFIHAKEIINPINEIYIISRDNTINQAFNGRNYLNFEKIKVVKHGIFPDINSAKKWFKSTDIFKEKSLPIAD